ncbi:MAG: RidA family protein [Zetaproteobacteria bacterium]|nr:MAG: RidA family protein [Zetaproteobacteria bacterium]
MKTIHTDYAPKAVGPYAQAVSAGGFLFCSGQIGLDPRTQQLVGDDVEAQAKQALANLEAVIAAAERSKEDIVKVTIFLVSMDDFPKVNAIYADWLGAHRPARATVGVASLPLGAKVEIEAIVRDGD